ncbi:lysylphosphatidylglycerol synthase transmembrane domain-containing protein [Gilvimarinus polysaccharolyticus]|uniref:lysylphosphatidylglycerol synthase transmembrane domain-containing protein n=1 Tax=Gilvimarinus polysaccharolyticus TaxID=863921 RepID=UPI0006736BF2|nr:lysylphosphatidylglycerol synthase transmembrane domain-containing protein [Gilvimarinus polysaccharolyticus]
MQKTIKISLLLGGLFALVFFLVDFSELFSVFAKVSFRTLLVVLAFYLVFYIANAKTLMLFMSAMGHRLSLLDSLGVNQLSSLFNYVAPFRVGQFAVKAVLVRLLSGMPVSSSAVIFFLISLLSLIVSAFLFLVTVFLLDGSTLYKEYIVPIIFFLLALFGVGMILWLAGGLKFVRGRLSKLEVLIPILSVKLILSCVALLAIQVVVGSIITMVFLAGVDVPIKLVDAIFLSSVASVVFVLSVTPGNLGAKELTFVGIGLGLGIPEAPMLAILIVDRLLQIFMASIFSVGFFYTHRSLVVKAFSSN